MKYKLKAYSIWEYGKRKDAAGNPHQEDSLFPQHGKIKDSDRLFILCDGMGGHDAGEVASSTVCETMSDTILKECPDAEGDFTQQDLAKAIKNAYEALDAKDNGADKKMGTTMTLLKLFDNGACIAHIGDSRVYHIRPGKSGQDTHILFETQDHSLINDLIRMGEMTREEARHSGQKNVITRAMQPGTDNRCKADVRWIEDIQPGDYFYMCSDGMLEQDEMEDGTALKNIFSKAIKKDEEKIKILTGATDENKDNHTAIIVHILDVKKTKNKKALLSPHKVGNNDAVTPASKHIATVEEGNKKSKLLKKILFWLVSLLIIAAFAIWAIGKLKENKDENQLVNEQQEQTFSKPTEKKHKKQHIAVSNDQEKPKNTISDKELEKAQENTLKQGKIEKLKDFHQEDKETYTDINQSKDIEN